MNAILLQEFRKWLGERIEECHAVIDCLGMGNVKPWKIRLETLEEVERQIGGKCCKFVVEPNNLGSGMEI